ncbi:MAG: carboxypeptidase-like regulatory domain-containing protein, partial [Gemmatimonadota bacterium]
CSAGPAPAAGAGILVGVVRGEGAAPLAGARVTLSGGGRELEARTDARGVYRFCGAPALAPLAVRVEAPGAVVRTTLRLEGEPVLQDFAVGPVAAVAAGAGRTAAAGRGAVSGRVLSGPEGRPLAGATVELAGGGRATTDAQGRFTLRGVAAGTRSVSVAHPRHGTRTAEVAVDAGADLELRLGEGMRLAALVTTPYTLDPLRVEARSERRSLATAGFYERQKTGNGFFLTEGQFRRGAPLSSVMRTVPGVRVIRFSPPPPEKCGRTCGNPPAEWRLVPSRSVGGGRISMSADTRTAAQCMMPVFLDGVRVVSPSGEQGNDIDRVSTNDVVAIEVYRNAPEIPAQFAGANQGCGVVLMWTQAEPTPGR